MEVDLSELILAAASLQREWDAAGIRFCFIGGLAVHRWGQPRQTDDIDATVWTEFGNERPVIDGLLQGLVGRIEHVAQFALENRVLLCREANGLDVDVSLAAFPFEHELIERARFEMFRETPLRVCGPSDLVIF